MKNTGKTEKLEPWSTPSRDNPGRWYPFIHWLCQRVYYSRIRLLHPERLAGAKEVPVLYLGLHRNGAMDGFIHHALFPKQTFLITSNLRRHRFLRLFFSGIEVLRKKDPASSPAARKATNLAALDRCQAHLAANGQLLVFPEGTSDLGPHHLPFQSGAARILLRFLEEHPVRNIAVIPLGIHYERAWAFRSRVEMLVGHQINTDFDPESTHRTRLGILKRRINEALEDVGANFPTPEDQQRSEAAAYASTLGAGHTYTEALQRFAHHLPERIANHWSSLRESKEWPKLWLHQGVPLIPLKRRLLPLYAFWFAISAPWVALGSLLNAPPLLAAHLTGKRCADEPNVIALWRVLVGLPASLLWVTFLIFVTVTTSHWVLFAGYLAVSTLGLLSYYRVKKLAVTIHNGLRFPRLRPEALQFHRSILNSLSNEDTTRSILDSVPSAH